MPRRSIGGAVSLVFAVASAALLGGCHDDPKGCTTARDCQGDQVCTAGTCQRPGGGPLGDVGATCADPGACLIGLGCTTDAFGFPDGICTQSCLQTACPTGSACADLRSTAAAAKLCAKSCTADADCRSGYNCCAAFANVCLPPGLCPQTGLGASVDLGTACTATTCAAGEACRTGGDFPGGVCTRSCAVGNDATCPTNGRCAVTSAGPLCLPSCSAPADCRAGYACAPASGGGSVCSASGGGARTCTPPGSPQLIAGGLVGPSSPPQGCIKPIGRSALPAAQVQSFGTHRVGDQVAFTVPAGAGSVSVVSQAVSASDTIQFQSHTLQNTVVPLITGPDGTVLWNDNYDPDAGLELLPVFYGTSSPSTGSLTMPNTSGGLTHLAVDGGLPGGSWSFTVNDFAAECLNTNGCDGGSSANTYDMSVIVKPLAPPSTGTIDVAFYIIGAQGLTSASATSDARIKRMVNTLSTLYTNAGLCLGTVTFYDVPQWARDKYATSIDADKDGACDNLSQMFTLARAGNTLNFFLVEQISSTSAGGQVVGIDGTIPGPSSIGGTVHSGAAVSGVDLNSGTCGGALNLASCGADRVAFIAAHEGGHWMGLYHTTESPGDSFDTLSDTPTCRCTTCASGSRKNGCFVPPNPTLVNATECSQGVTCGGADNLMFWLLDENVARGLLSAHQAQVMRANPLVQ